MIKSDDTALALLDSLLRIGRDSAEGYATAARDIAEPDLARLFEDYGRQRQKIVGELENRVRELRGDPEGSPTLPGAAHRAWMDYQADAAANPIAALLTEVERGEAIAVDAYRMALKEQDIDRATRQLLERHYELIQAAHDRVKQLRERADFART